MSRRVSSGRLVGRTRELDRALAVLRDDGHAATTRIILIAGEAGIGKTRLLDEVLAQARRLGGLTACGRCVEHGGEIRPLTAFVDLLTDLAAMTSPAVVDAYPDLSPLVSGRSAAGSTALASDPARLFQQVPALLADVARGGRLTVAVEDIHWADRTSRALIAELARARHLEHVTLIATFRSDELHRRHPLLPLLADLEQVGRPERIELGPLDDDDIVALAGDVLDHPLADEARRQLVRRSGGNPFYAEELLASGDDATQLPAGVRHVILARAQRLTPDAMRCLDAASTLAAPIGADVLQVTTAMDGAQFRAAIDAVCRERLLVDLAGSLRFRHELVREVFLGELLPGERTALFAAAAAALERLRPEQLGEIARLHVDAMQLPHALRASIRAGAAAEALGAPAEASAHYARALDMWGRIDGAASWADVSVVELLRRSARAADLARDFDLAVDLARRALDAVSGDADAQRGEILNDLAGYLWNSGAPGMEEVIEQALEVLPPEPTVGRAQLEIRLGGRLAARGEYEASDAALRRAAEMAVRLGERGIEANAIAHIGYHRAELGDEEVLARIRHGLALALSADDGYAIVRICINLSNALVFLGRFEEVAELYGPGVSAAERHGLMPTFGILFQGNVIEALEALGRWDEAGAIVDDVERRMSADSLYRWASALSGWSQIQVNRGEYGPAARTFRRGWELHSTGYYGGEVGQLGTGTIELAAVGALDPVPVSTVAGWLDDVPPGESTYGARMVAAAARHLVPPRGAAGHDDAVSTVQALVDRLRCVAAEQYLVVPTALDVWLDEATAELAESAGDLDPQRWARIDATWTGIGCVFLAASARFRQAAALLRAGGGRAAGERAAARDLLVAAERTARQLRADPLLGQITELAQRARLDLDRRPAVDIDQEPASPLGLTRRETEVLRLVTLGRSNAEVGEALYISTKTASVHVSNILRKLGATNRIEAAAIARRHRL